MNKHEGCKRGYIRSDRAWYSGSTWKVRDDGEEIMFGMYAEEGGTSGEMAMRWRYVGGEWIPRLEAYNGSWDALFSFADLLESMAKADDFYLTPDQFAALLEAHGFEDITKYEDPYECPTERDLVQYINKLSIELGEAKGNLERLLQRRKNRIEGHNDRR